jgi:putative ABC transport system permease protein
MSITEHPTIEEQQYTLSLLRHTWQTRRVRGFPALLRNCVSALRALRTNTLRSLLTSLGIIIGVGAVIMMLSVSEGIAALVNQHFSLLSPNELIISPQSTNTQGVRLGSGTGKNLMQADADAIAQQVPHITAVSPVLNAAGQVIFQNQNWATSVQGVYPNFQQINNWQVQEGSFITDSDERSAHAVAVIGQTVADNLFTRLGVDPIGQGIRIRNVPFTVIGVLAPKGAIGVTDADDIVYIPYSTAQQRVVGGSYVSSIDVQVESSEHVNDVQKVIQQALEQRHHIADPSQDDFTIWDQNQILQMAQRIGQSLTVLLVSIAAVSLVVGGIGIMNIMLVSVTERTREIGVRIAIGARPQDVMTQFLIEAVMLSVIGGVIGTLLGIVGAFINAKANHYPFVLDPLSVLLAFGFAAIVGIIFGFYPAQRAARLDPIVALRAE